MKRHSLLRNAAYYTLSGYILMPLSLVSSILMRRWLDPHVYGVIATLNLFVSYSIFSSLGTLSAAEVSLPFFRGQGALGRMERLRSASFTFVTIAGTIFSAGVLAWTVASRKNLDGYLFLGLLVYCFYFLLNQVSSYYVTLLRADGEFVFLSKYQLFSGMLAVAGNPLGVWFFGYRGFLAASLLGVMLQLYFVYRHVNYLPAFRIDLGEARDLLISGIPMFVLGLTAQGMKTVDNLLVLKLLGISQLGYYTVALMANMLIFSVTNSLSTVLFPAMQESYGKSGNAENLTAYIVRPSIVMGLVLPLMMGALYFLVPWMVNWLIPRFGPGIPAFRIVTMSTYFFAMTNMTVGYLISVGKQRQIILINAATLLLIALIAYLFDRMGLGLSGIALATGTGYFCGFVISSLYVLRHWSGWEEALLFLRDTILPFVYSLFLVVGIGHFLDAGNADRHFKDAAFLMLVYFVLYTPLMFLFERKTRLYADVFGPLLRKVFG